MKLNFGILVQGVFIEALCRIYVLNSEKDFVNCVVKKI